MKTNKIIITQSRKISLEESELSAPRANMVQIKHLSIGMNFGEITQRKNSEKLPDSFCPGVESCGVVEAVGENVDYYKQGDIVAYVNAENGSYCDFRNIHKDLLVKVPSEINAIDCAGILGKAMFAHMMLHRVFLIKPGMTMLVHSAAGAVGSFLCQLGSKYGANVIGTVGSDAKIPYAKSNGCNHVINYETDDFVKNVQEITNGKLAQVVFDSVGKTTFKKSFECLSYFGLMASFGSSSGPAEQISPEILAERCLFLTHPRMAVYKSERKEFILSAGEIFSMLKKGIIKGNVNKYKFTDVKQAHLDMGLRKNVGSNVLIF